MFCLRFFFQDAKTEQLSGTGKIRPVGLGNPRDAAIGERFQLIEFGIERFEITHQTFQYRIAAILRF